MQQLQTLSQLSDVKIRDKNKNLDSAMKSNDTEVLGVTLR